jgi:hypothetical protein
MRRNSLGSQPNQFSSQSSGFSSWSSSNMAPPGNSSSFLQQLNNQNASQSSFLTNNQANLMANNQLSMLESNNLKSIFLGASSASQNTSDQFSSLIADTTGSSSSSPIYQQSQYEIMSNQENNISNLLSLSAFNDLYSNGNANTSNSHMDSQLSQLSYNSTLNNASYAQFAQQQQQQQQLSLQQQAMQAKLNMRRKTYGPSSLSTVLETRSTSPNHVFNMSYQDQLFNNHHQQQQQQQQQQQLIDQKLNLLSNNASSSSNSNVNQFLALSMSKNLKASQIGGGSSNSNQTGFVRTPFQPQQMNTPSTSSFMNMSQLNSKLANDMILKPRPRAFSVANASAAAAALSCLKSFDLNNNSINSIGSANTSLSGSSGLLYGSSSNLYTPTSLPSATSKVFFDSNDEKLATTGNIFQRREDWSILRKLPVNKQNTIHIRVEDEGPYGNDETRCFVLSHFSSLNIREINCVFCDCELVIYDRFPLVDGTLFVSPFMYDKAKSIPSVVSHKQQYINAVCLKCMMCEPDHEVRCLHCSTLWQSSGATSFQIGTLYKFDLFAALPCCQRRLACLNCDESIVDVRTVRESPEFNFSWFSEERQCAQCRVKAFHFVKPLKEIFTKSVCEEKRDDQMSKEFSKE